MLVAVSPTYGTLLTPDRQIRWLGGATLCPWALYLGRTGLSAKGPGVWRSRRSKIRQQPFVLGPKDQGHSTAGLSEQECARNGQMTVPFSHFAMSNTRSTRNIFILRRT